MTHFGVDYATTRPAISTLRRYDVKFVCRYISTPGNAKNLTKTEADELLHNNIAIVIVFETTADRAIGGRAAGAEDARSAEKQVVECGLPKDTVVYYAIDFATGASNIENVKEYFRGANSVHGVTRTGCYGSYYTCRTLHAYGLVGYSWQTYAWSSGEWFDKANIRQERNGVKWPEGYVDYDTAYTMDYGQTPSPHEPKPRPHLIEGEEMPVLNLTPGGPAIVLGVPANARFIIFRADPGFRTNTQPSIRVGMHMPWKEQLAEPSWGHHVAIPCEGMEEVTVARMDMGNCPVTVEFSS